VFHTQAALRLEPQNPFAQFDLGFALFANGHPTNALAHLVQAVRLLPNGYDQNYNAIEMNFVLAMTQFRLALYEQCAASLRTVLGLAPQHAQANYFMAMSRARLGETQAALPFFDQAVRADAQLAQLPDFYDVLSANYVKQGSYGDALKAAEKGRQLAEQAGLAQQAAQLQQRVQECKRLLAPKSPGQPQ
jgi:tetratricopeptide (TPR) repeat protein